MTEEEKWQLVQGIADQTNCEKRKVGCLILDEHDAIVSTGYNYHMDRSCDCIPGPGSAIHAEHMATIGIPSAYKDTYLVAYINHKPCDKCVAMLEEAKVAIVYKELSKRLKTDTEQPGDVEDKVNPKHYSDVDNVPTIRFFEEATSPEGYKGYLQLTAMKYLYRLDSKDEPLVNVRKAKWFVEKLERHINETHN